MISKGRDIKMKTMPLFELCKHVFFLMAFPLILIWFVVGCDVLDNRISGYVGDDGDAGSQPTVKVPVVMASTSTLVVINEGSIGKAIFVFNKKPTENVELNWQIEGGASDFLSDHGNITVTPNMENIEIPLQAINDGVYEGPENFVLIVSPLDETLVSASASVNLKINEFTSVPVLSFSSSATSVMESDGVIDLVVNLSQPSSELVQVKIIKSGLLLENTDFTLLPGDTLSFGPGEVSKPYQIVLNDDAITEDLEDLRLVLSTVVNGTASIDSSKKQHLLVVQDNDSPLLFNLQGVSGGSDVLVDWFLTSAGAPRVHWTDAATETSYTAAIFESNGTSIRCSLVVLPANTTAHTFSGCSLTEGDIYKISVVAVVNGGPASAGNNMMPFKMDSTAPPAPLILGVSGGIDVSADRYLSGSTIPIFHWTDVLGESTYLVTIYQSDRVTVQCATVTVPANVTAFNLASCILSAGAQYSARISARDEAGLITEASNNYFDFLVTTNPSGYVILGATGGTADTVADESLNDGVEATVHWQDASGEISYDVTIYEQDGTTVHCPTVNVPADQVSYTFISCGFDLNQPYKIKITAYDSLSNPFSAGNDFFEFRYKAGLFISGTGGSYHKGVAITTCGGAQGDVCNAATSYIADDVVAESQIRIANNGVLRGKAWVSNAPVVGNGILDVEADRLWIESGSSISMAGRGFTAGNGPSPGSDYFAPNYPTGGAYGGTGGRIGTSAPATSYGNITFPVDLGSPGGSRSTYLGGAGGGAVRITVANTLYLDGAIYSNGAAGGGYKPMAGPAESAGGGSGGSILIQVKTLLGTGGLVQANGGNAFFDANAGNGSGGRIGFYYEDATGYSTGSVAGVTFNSQGGTNFNESTGAAGTIYFKDTNNDIGGFLVVDNGVGNPHLQGIETRAPLGLVLDGISTKNLGTIIIPANEIFELLSPSLGFRLVAEGTMELPGGGMNLTIASGGWLEWRRKTTINYNSLTIESGGVLTHSHNKVLKDYLLDIDVTTLTLRGTISAKGRGFATGEGPGATSGVAGGAYGGQSGPGSNGQSGDPYGNLLFPSEFGSGGGNKNLTWPVGQAGGGLIKISADNFIFEGTIDASGYDGTGSYGGGAGGSVFLEIFNQLMASVGSVVKSNGGNNTAGSAGGGSGGRIAFYYNMDSVDDAVGFNNITFSALGGDGGSNDGAAGTIFYQNVAVDTIGHFVVNNTGRVYSEFITTPLMDIIAFDSIQTIGTGTILIPIGYNYLLPTSTINFRLVLEGDIQLPGGGSGNLIIENGGYLEFRRNLQKTFDSVTVKSGGVITSTNNSYSKSYYVGMVANDISVESGGLVHVNGRGYLAQNGPGAGFSGGGAGHGGYGGLTSAGGLGGVPYDDLKEPIEFGSGGGGSCGGDGGGLIRLVANNSLTIDGSIEATGNNGGGDCGGGAGGSVHLVTDHILGAGKVNVRGGDGTGTGTSGSGGRISVEAASTGNVDLLSYDMRGGTLADKKTGAAGLLFVKGPADTSGRVIADNGANLYVQGVETASPLSLDGNMDVDSVETRGLATILISSNENLPLQSTSLNYRIAVAGNFSLPGGSKNLIVANGGYLEWRKSVPLQLDSLTVQSGGEVSHSGNISNPNYLLQIELANFFTLDFGGAVNVSGKGYSIGGGTGGSGSPSTAGGAHGGKSGRGIAHGVRPSYGAHDNPSDLGSGAETSSGGGLIKILVPTGTMTLNGSIQANGTNASSCGEMGGSAGGGIYLLTNVLAGNKANYVLSADGGNGCTNGGGGSGGRIALLYQTDSVGVDVANDLNMSAKGGAGYTAGSAGTIFVKDIDSEVGGHLIVRNGGNPYDPAVTTPLPNGGTFDSVITDSGSALEVPFGSTFNLPTSNLNYRLIVSGTITAPGNILNVMNQGILEMRRLANLWMDSITVAVGGVVTHTANTSAKSYTIDLSANSMTIAGTIQSTGMGYAVGYGEGAAPSLGNTGAAGGGFGGTGGHGLGSIVGDGYGSFRAPNHLGSPGGKATSTTGSAGGSGGGLVRLTVAGTLTLDGTIAAKGNDGVANGGGGSGGTVRIQTGTLAGNGGRIDVRGGQGNGNGGCGGGGRVALSYTTDSYTGGISSLSIDSEGGFNCGTKAGGAGTALLTNGASDILKIANTNGVDNTTNSHVWGSEAAIMVSTEADDTIVVSSDSGVYVAPSTNFHVPSATLSFPLRTASVPVWISNDLTISSTGKLSWDTNQILSLNSLTMLGGSMLTHGSNGAVKSMYLDLNIVTNMTMNTGSSIDVSARGHCSSGGTGRGTSTVVTTNGAGGGGYGGAGAAGDGGVAGGPTYGLPTDPVLLGSGGGDSSASVGCAGGAGGGLVIISAPAGTLDLNGSITADGGNPICSAKTGGGGSGGSVKLVSDILTGSGGSINAKGGMPIGCTVDCGGSGGGGRIYLQYNSGDHSGISLSAAGGAGAYSGAAGTISTP